MPLVHVSCSANVNTSLKLSLSQALPWIVARHLNQPDHPVFALTPSDVEVRFDESPYSLRHHDVEIVITALKSEERIKTGKLRTDDIATEVQARLPKGMTGFVWTTLVDGFFTSF